MAAPMEGKFAFFRICKLASLSRRQTHLTLIQCRSMGFLDRLRPNSRSKETERESKVVVSEDYAQESDPVPVEARQFKKRQCIEEVRAYKPPSNVVPCIEAITKQIYGKEHTDWQQIELHNRIHKFNLVTWVMESLDHEVPNINLHEMKTVADVVKYFQTQVHDTSKLEDLTKLDLPKNLHMNLEFIRFDRENDQIYKGVTAFPGRPTIVPSVKYKRKYKGYDGGDPVNYPEEIIGNQL